MSRIRTVLSAPPDKWWDAALGTTGALPGSWRAGLASGATRMSRTFAVDRLARSAAVSRDPRGPELVAQFATRGELGVSEVLEKAVTGNLRRLAPRQLLSLAWLLFVQHRDPADYESACVLFDHVHARDHVTRWDERFQRIYAEALLSTGRRADAGAVIRDLPSGVERDMLAIDAQRTGTEDPHAEALSALWTSRGVVGPQVIPGEVPAFDRLRAPSAPSEPDGPLVTVVISSYKPDHRLIHAVTSIARQSWKSLEILVCDDASGAEYTSVYDEVARLDPRVHVHTMDANGGTYAIRNWALEHAQGEFLTFHDSDDWMHPERVAVQMRHLLTHPGVLHNASRSARVTEDLRFSHTRNLGAQICEPSLLLRREAALEAVGTFDPVRKGADAEYRLRLERVTGVDTTVCGDAPLTLQVVTGDSLSGTDIVRHWFAPARRVYRSCFENWHQTSEDLRLTTDSKRPFYAPQAVLGADIDRTPEFVVVSNWLEYGTWNADCPAAASIVASLVGHGHRVAIAHESALLPLARMRASLSDHTAAMLNAGQPTYVEIHDLSDHPAIVVVAPSTSQAAAAHAHTHRVLNYRPGSRRGARAVTRAALELLAR